MTSPLPAGRTTPPAAALPPAVDVLIVGAGPAGLTLAVDLARHGVRALLVERDAWLAPGARGTGLKPRTQEVYDDLGVLPAINEWARPYPPAAVWVDGRPTGEETLIEQVDPSPSVPYSNTLRIPQDRTLQALYGRLRELGGEVAFATSLVDWTEDGEGVSARLDRHGAPRTVRAAYLVGTDGGRSTVRRALGVGMTGHGLGVGTGVVADVRVSGLDAGHWHQWRHSTGGMFALLPLGEGDRWQLVSYQREGDVPLTADGGPDLSLAGLRGHVERFSTLTPDRLAAVDWVSAFSPRAALAERFRAGRVLLAGDAAHIHSPAGGFGLNTSVQDAYNLGWKLAAVLRHGVDEALLETYEAERRPVAEDILTRSSHLHRTRILRRGRELNQLDVGYPGGPLADERRTGLPENALRAGDRAPDAPLTTPDGRPRTLFDTYRGPHFTLLTLGDTPTPHHTDPRLRTIRIGGPHPDLLDPHHHATTAYAPTGHFLIRPDGYLHTAAPTLTPHDLTTALHTTGSAPVATVR
ncbi:FAD-dependent oxidoreductase [Streptomyces sp. NPDC059740]|uniref:FAD-dependent oxidoreductase n=1 Tax=Streptomyces sp. NPDC059740 TaxID=3346926 RepID=UPI003655421D